MGEPLKFQKVSTKKLYVGASEKEPIRLATSGAVKSAVEFLKRNVVLCRDDDERTKYDIDKILELINEAFPKFNNIFMVELAQKEVLDKLKEQISEKIIVVKTNDGGTYEKVACYPRMVVDNAIDKLLNTKNSENTIKDDRECKVCNKKLSEHSRFSDDHTYISNKKNKEAI